MIALFFAGFVIGKFLKIDWIRKYKILIILTFLLLFALGVEIGSNDDVVSQLKTILSSSFMISTFAVLGSFVAAVFFGRMFKK
ncbi:MAG: LysO family transporter [Pseudothermotoga sp.]